ncbi:MAG TPA: DoxX family protein [Acidimicrobiales bacterium]|nr:DoxX family protein [Acidimicrobiales bacterium]
MTATKTATTATTATSTFRRAPALLRLVLGTESTSTTTDAALAVVRAALAWVFIYYGGQKLFGFSYGPGPHGIHQTALYFAHGAHLQPGQLFAIVGGLVEFFGGVAMAVGFFTRLAGLALLGDMVMAVITVTWAQGFNSISTPPGYDLNIVVAALAVVAVLMGAGRLSVDAFITRRLFQTDPEPQATTSRPRNIAQVAPSQLDHLAHPAIQDSPAGGQGEPA